ncbi:acetylornithine deacetylase [uncultured Kiloniella sp.]|uniref:acetylornithine deacetylase n=1 Tax=uncultured Kiloniella sp. TaxID=1133091 RepID=UPI00262878F0|nr:acetylornithine deacetylase [uncultured Kiloniella sp.]
MTELLASTKEILSKLVSFQSLSGQSNLDMIGYIEEYLKEHGVSSSLSYDETKQKANLYATIGPEVKGGVVLNGHTDVVPVKGQTWTIDPFVLTERNNRLYGRGAVDMKGFLACSLAMVPVFQAQNLQRPIHVSFCYDEEIGGFGAPVLADDIITKNFKPDAVIVGEPTNMSLVTGHKAGMEITTRFTGFEVHSSQPEKGVNAIEFASRFIGKILEVGARLAAAPKIGSPFDPPYTTCNVGRIDGGAASNITAGRCEMIWEIRPIPGDNGQAIFQEILDFSDHVLLPEMRKISPDANIETILDADVPSLDACDDSPAVQLIRTLTGSNVQNVVSFGTDAGYFERVGLSTVVFGPGSIDQAHKPDEFIEISELERCLTFLHDLAKHQSR